MTDTKVRLGVPEDEDALIELSMRAWSENGFMDVNPEKMRAMIRPALYLWQGLIGVIGKPNEKIEGAILLRMTQVWYSDSWLLEEKAVFVDPDYRSTSARSDGQTRSHARLLVDFSKSVADSVGIPLLIGVLSNHRTDAKIRLYERQLGAPAGAFFLYGAKTGHENMTEQ